MKYTFIIIALFAVLITTSSAHNEQVFDTSVGALAPIVKIDDASANKSVDTGDMRGEYILLSFWSSTDAASRVACNTYDAMTTDINSDSNSHHSLRHVSINFDTDKDIFNEVVRRDNLNEEMQFNVQGDMARKITGDFHLEDGFGTLLIGPDGRVLAKNPTRSALIGTI